MELKRRENLCVPAPRVPARGNHSTAHGNHSIFGPTGFTCAYAPMYMVRLCQRQDRNSIPDRYIHENVITFDIPPQKKNALSNNLILKLLFKLIDNN